MEKQDDHQSKSAFATAFLAYAESHGKMVRGQSLIKITR
jgi:hypothetical protein